ncbi:helix-turn-helix transcriptional regulator [Pseudaminobacter arsenicus]|uniref:Helix-turn-helix transcriptional regulator n=1 Tax=Borborobacter arsenicus TaxID=1851146 RepID=A0A432V509_9HYPH|nr:helix-turn-helix transcriptional regulator [Pseudaminobacter arsenicus]RUM97240.1 helix-turn-helix transcriptional regulator [Pseudaminobacter arsenicus]
MTHASLIDDQLVDLIYAAVLGESDWTDFLAELSSALPDGRSTLFYHDISQQKGAWELNHGLDERTLANYSAYYARINPWMPKASIRPVGIGVVAEQMLPAETFRQSEFYNDLFRPIGGETAVGVTIMREEGCSFLLSTLTSRADPEKNKAVADRLTTIAPHLRRAFNYYRGRAVQISEAGSSLFNAIDIGFMVIGEGAIAKSVSPAGERIIEQSGCVTTTPLGTVRLCCAQANTLLQNMLDRTYAGEKTNSVLTGSVKLTLVKVNKDLCSAYFEGPTVILLMEPVKPDRSKVQSIGDGSSLPNLSQIFGQRFGLTPAEQRLTTRIAQGERLNDAASLEGITKETARTRLKAIFSKTGTGRQAELILLAQKLQGDVPD